MPISPRAITAVAALLAAATALSCSEAVIGPDRGEGVDPDILTPAVAAQLDATGYFPQQQPEAGYQQPIGRAAAEAIARGFLVDSAAALGAFWAQGHGAPINFERLVRCAPTLYASSAYEVASMLPAYVDRRFHLGQYIVQYCSRAGVPQLLVAVAVEPPLPGAPGSSPDHNLFVFPIPLELATPMLVTAERAAQLAAARTGRRVAAVPELVMPRFVPLPWQARWLVQLESSVEIVGLRTAETDTVSAVLVGIDEFGYGLTTTLLRPRLRATMSERTDSLSGGGPGGFDFYTARIGLPRGVEPFVIP